MAKKQYKVCNKCGAENPLKAVTCSKPECNSEKFAPEYIRKLEPITRNTFVQATLPADKKEERITLYKWWPGGKSSFNINTIEQWEKIRNAIEDKILPHLNWETKEKILSEIKEVEKSKDSVKEEEYLYKLTKSYPDLVKKILKEVDLNEIDDSNYTEYADIINELSEIVAKTDTGFRQAFRNVVKKLPKQKKKAIEDLSELLETWTLKQITAVSTQVVERLQTLELFKEQVLDDRTFEIKGDKSIHRILERAMWIVDERYWLMHSNRTLRKIVEKKLSEKAEEFKDKRPDFVCGTVGTKLIIIELKRPSHELKKADLDQLENYLTIIDEHSTSHKSFEAYLIGQKISDDLKKRMKYRGSQFKIMTFSDLIDDTEKRYREFIEAMEE